MRGSSAEDFCHTLLALEWPFGQRKFTSVQAHLFKAAQQAKILLATRPSAVANPASLLQGGTTRTNQTFDGATTSRVEIYLANGSASASSVIISAIMAQVLPTGTSVASGGFIDGKGTTALQFNSPLNIEYYSSNVNEGQIGLSASFVEVD